jgi:hypothetical protein
VPLNPLPGEARTPNAERSRIRELWTGIRTACAGVVQPLGCGQGTPDLDDSQPRASRVAIPPGLPPTARKIGYHGTSLAGYQRILARGIEPSGALRTGMAVASRPPVFYITDRWDTALSYASGPEQILEIWCVDCTALSRDALRKNAQGATEVKIRGGFDALVAIPASTEKHLPVSFHALGFSAPNEPDTADRGGAPALSR